MAYHHFVGDELNRSEKIQALVVNQLLNSQVSNAKRESSVQWELKHSSGVIQIARLLAQKRGINEKNEELAVIAAALHDIYVILEGGYTEHAIRGAVVAKKILEESQDFSNSEIEKITDAIKNHSDKHIYSDDELVELIKDADCMDCFFYGDRVYETEGKSPKLLKHYYKRIIDIRKELGLAPKKYLESRLNELEAIE
jgi:uncharacterized protein